ncbi:hypothetical protein DXU77_23680 [Pseudomonas lactis]|nr:hypothetical protein [Pseudomonas lactis]
MGVGLARDAGNSDRLSHRVDAVAGKPAPTLGFIPPGFRATCGSCRSNRHLPAPPMARDRTG